jgi:hypothetical protein
VPLSARLTPTGETAVFRIVTKELAVPIIGSVADRRSHQAGRPTIASTAGARTGITTRSESHGHRKADHVDI